MSKTFNSFAELGKAMGVKSKPARESKSIKCKACGGDMVMVEGTNVRVCTGQTEMQKKDGTKVMVPCERKIIY